MSIIHTVRRHLGYYHVDSTVEKFCMFIGYPRSGHTLVRSLLDAHPNIVLANEEDVLLHIAQGLHSRKRLYARLLRNSYTFTKYGNTWTGYSYTIPNSFQGTYTELKVIGDKKGGMSTQRLHRDPTLLTKLCDVVHVPVAIFHCIRNPYDNIASMSIKSNRTLDAVIRDYTERVHFIDSWCKKVREHVTYYDIIHEQLVADPQRVCNGMLEFLNMPVSKEYMQQVENVVRTTPHAISKTVDWSEAQRNLVQTLIHTIPFLQYYAEK